MKWGEGRETSLAVQLLRLPSSTAGGMGSSLVGELRSHIKKNSPNHPPPPATNPAEKNDTEGIWRRSQPLDLGEKAGVLHRLPVLLVWQWDAKDWTSKLADACVRAWAGWKKRSRGFGWKLTLSQATPLVFSSMSLSPVPILVTSPQDDSSPSLASLHASVPQSILQALARAF